MTCFEFLNCTLLKVRQKTGTSDCLSIEGGDANQVPHILLDRGDSQAALVIVRREKPHTIHFKMRLRDLGIIEIFQVRWVNPVGDVWIDCRSGARIRGINSQSINWEEIADQLAESVVSLGCISKNTLNLLVTAMEEVDHGNGPG
jgi:hypothetical protein